MLFGGVMEMDVEAIVERVKGIRHGFGPMKVEAEGIVGNCRVVDSLEVGKALLGSEVYQGRMVGTFVLGMIAYEAREAFGLLLAQVSLDPSWQVQEILAQAFDMYCSKIGYEKALPIMREWLGHSNANVRRAASEGPRIWTTRPYFRDNPEVALEMLAGLRGDSSEYVRKSVGNAIRDISRKHSELVREEVARWDLTNPFEAYTYKLASRFLI